MLYYYYLLFIPFSSINNSPLPLTSNNKDLEDRISQLLDEMLVSILPFLTMKEAVGTSVLSHRWKHLWPFFTGCLVFDDPDTFWDIADEKKKI